MKRVLVESPFASGPDFSEAENVRYLKQCLTACLMQDESPYASHLFFKQFLDDQHPIERALGIEAGLAWGMAAELTVVYTDHGISSGMRYGIDAALKAGRPIEYRSLSHLDGKWPEQTVTATLIAPTGERFVGTNSVVNEHRHCPSGDMPTGVGYGLCQTVCVQTAHAEVNAIRKAGDYAKGAAIWIEGHTYACDPCQEAAAKADVQLIHFAAPPTQ